MSVYASSWEGGQRGAGGRCKPLSLPKIVFRPRADGRRRAGDKRKPMPVPLKKFLSKRGLIAVVEGDVFK